MLVEAATIHGKEHPALSLAGMLLMQSAPKVRRLTPMEEMPDGKREHMMKIQRQAAAKMKAEAIARYEKAFGGKRRTTNELCEIMGVTVSGVGKMLWQLEKEGVVKKVGEKGTHHSIVWKWLGVKKQKVEQGSERKAA